jgi:hypothetical protein
VSASITKMKTKKIHNTEKIDSINLATCVLSFMYMLAQIFLMKDDSGMS